MGGVSVAYLSDHQMPADGSNEVSDSALELCEGVDLLIHDAQYTSDEFSAKSTWGHCTPDYAVQVAAKAGVRTLALFHHDPSHNDAAVDVMLAKARDRAQGTAIGEVIAAHEGLVIAFA